MARRLAAGGLGLILLGAGAADAADNNAWLAYAAAAAAGAVEADDADRQWPAALARLRERLVPTDDPA
jgi:hypothetical protein